MTVEVRKKRTYVKRSVVQDEEKLRLEEEAAQKAAEEAAEAARQAEIDAQRQAEEAEAQRKVEEETRAKAEQEALAAQETARRTGSAPLGADFNVRTAPHDHPSLLELARRDPADTNSVPARAGRHATEASRCDTEATGGCA